MYRVTNISGDSLKTVGGSSLVNLGSWYRSDFLYIFQRSNVLGLIGVPNLCSIVKVWPHKS